MSAEDDLVSEIISRVAHEQGVALSRDDPLITAVFLNRAILARYLDQALNPIVQAIADAVARAQQDLAEHAQAQVAYVEQAMLKDRERFVAEQKALLEAMDARLRERDAGLVEVMSEVVERARARVEAERVGGGKQMAVQGPRAGSGGAAFGALVLGVVLGAVGVIGGAWVVLWMGIGQ